MHDTKTVDPRVKYKRIILKLCGEVLRGGKSGDPIDAATLEKICAQVKEIHDLGVADLRRDRRRQHLPRAQRRKARRRPHHRRLHGHARHRHQRPRADGLPGKNGRHHPRAERDPDEPDRRAVHPPPRHAPPGKGPRRHLRRRHGQPVFLDRHHRRPARARDARRHHHEGHEGRRHLRQGPEEISRRRQIRGDHASSTRSSSGSTSWTRPRSRSASTTTSPSSCSTSNDEHAIRRAVLGEKIGTLVHS